MSNIKYPHDNPDLDAASRELLGWFQLLDKLESKWLSLGLGQLWTLRRMDFNQHIELLNESTGNGTLFDLEEQEEKRLQLKRYLEHTFISKMQNNLPNGIWYRIFRKSRGNIEDLKREYAARGRSKEFDAEFGLLQRKTEEIQLRKVSGLYDQQERATRLLPQVRAERRLFRHRQKLDLRMYDHFRRLTRSLPDDDLDLQLESLADSYLLIGRSREWFDEYEKMINEVSDAFKNVDQGQNEPFVRLLQNDFLLAMQSKFSRFWRFHELRQYCFKHDCDDLITRFGYFNHRSLTGDKTVESEVLITHFIRSIEVAIRGKLRDNLLQNNLLKRRREQLLSIDHEVRLAQWASFKQQYIGSESGTVETFNHFKPILIQCAEWRHELKVFRALIKVQRLADRARKNSAMELTEADQFIKRMVTRVDGEIATEIAFKILEQNLIKDQEFLDDLNQVQRSIALEKESRISQSAEDVMRIKQAFIQAIWEKRALVQEGAPVIALFSPRMPGKSDGKNKNDRQDIRK